MCKIPKISSLILIALLNFATSILVSRISNNRLCHPHPKGCTVPYSSIQGFRSNKDPHKRTIECETPVIPFEGNCSALVIITSELNSELIDVISKSDMDPSVRRISIHINSSMSNINSTEIGYQLDEILGPRPWWQPVIEPFSWLKRGHSSIVLERYHHDWESHLKYLATVQYPTKENCAKSNMVVSSIGSY